MDTDTYRFVDRDDAGQRLAALVEAVVSSPPRDDRLPTDHSADDVIVLGLPRGGVPVAAAVAARLGAPLHVLVARKLGAPQQPEFAIGAVVEAGARVIDLDLARRCGVDGGAIAAVEQRERDRVAAQAECFGVGRRPSLRGRTVVIVDDGIATGATARAACRAARAMGARRVVLAVAAAPADWRTQMRDEADDLVCVVEEDVPAVGYWYADFGQVSDRDVVLALEAATTRPSDGVGPTGPTPGSTGRPR